MGIDRVVLMNYIIKEFKFQIFCLSIFSMFALSVNAIIVLICVG